MYSQGPARLHGFEFLGIHGKMGSDYYKGHG